jgi:hypothetical protein
MFLAVKSERGDIGEEFCGEVDIKRGVKCGVLSEFNWLRVETSGGLL